MNYEKGNNVVLGENIKLGNDVYIGHNCIVEDDVTIGDNVYIDSNTIIRSGTTIGSNSFVQSNCIIGEYQMDFCLDRKKHEHTLSIGDNAIIRSATIIYTGSTIGNDFQTGHRVTIREKSIIGNHVSLGTLTDVQGHCTIGDYVRTHSNCHIAQEAVIDNYVWLFPYVVLTNDLNPPSDDIAGVHIHSFAIIAADSLILPGREIGQDALVGAGSVVMKDVKPYMLVSGNPAKAIADVRKFNKVIGKEVYPWRNFFGRAMPWAEKGWDNWIASLSKEERRLFKVDEII